MKIFVPFLVLALFANYVSAQQIEPVNVDFKSISSTSTKYVTITNNTHSVLVIRSIKADCNCVKVEFSKKPITAGANASIKVTYRPKAGESGLFYKVVRVEYATQKNATEFTLRGVVK